MDQELIQIGLGQGGKNPAADSCMYVAVVPQQYGADIYDKMFAEIVPSMPLRNEYGGYISPIDEMQVYRRLKEEILKQAKALKIKRECIAFPFTEKAEDDMAYKMSYCISAKELRFTVQVNGEATDESYFYMTEAFGKAYELSSDPEHEEDRISVAITEAKTNRCCEVFDIPAGL